MTAAPHLFVPMQDSPISNASDLNKSLVPEHIAIIMDGNGRWATNRKLPRAAGHKRGVETVRTVVEACALRGVKYLTLFAFSSENWQRPAGEVSFLMRLFVSVLHREVRKMHAQGIRLRVVGDLTRFEPRLQHLVHDAERKTADNTGLTVTIAANYGGRWDIVQAARQCIAQAAARRVSEKEGHTSVQDALSEADFAQYLALAHAPEPDLFIRTGGEHRLSNFLLWQLAYTELYFTNIFWPDFDALALDAALASYQQRERRFGQLSGQINLPQE